MVSASTKSHIRLLRWQTRPLRELFLHLGITYAQALTLFTFYYHHQPGRKVMATMGTSLAICGISNPAQYMADV